MKLYGLVLGDSPEWFGWKKKKNHEFDLLDVYKCSGSLTPLFGLCANEVLPWGGKEFQVLC